MAKRFYFQAMGETVGPISGVDLRDKALIGEVRPDTLIRINEDGKWVPAARLKNLFDERGRPIPHSDIAGSAPSNLPPSPPATDRQKEYATSLGIDFPPDIDRRTISRLIDKAVAQKEAERAGAAEDRRQAWLKMREEVLEEIEADDCLLSKATIEQIAEEFENRGMGYILLTFDLEDVPDEEEVMRELMVRFAFSYYANDDLSSAETRMILALARDHIPD